jgi:hypothetical protein
MERAFAYRQQNLWSVGPILAERGIAGQRDSGENKRG